MTKLVRTKRMTEIQKVKTIPIIHKSPYKMMVVRMILMVKNKKNVQRDRHLKQKREMLQKIQLVAIYRTYQSQEKRVEVNLHDHQVHLEVEKEAKEAEEEAPTVVMINIPRTNMTLKHCKSYIWIQKIFKQKQKI